MSQGLIIALLVLAALSVLRVTNLPPFSSNSNTSQSPTAGQASPTPITRSTGFSTGVAIGGPEASFLSPNPIPPPPTDPAPIPSGTTQKPPITGRW